jgi:hypothetical protein
MWWPATVDCFARGLDVGGLDTYCKPCMRARNKARYAKRTGRAIELPADDVDLPIVRRIVAAAEAPPLEIAPLAHGWIPRLDDVRLEVVPRAGDVASQPVAWAAPLDWRPPASSATAAGPAPAETPMADVAAPARQQRHGRRARARGDASAYSAKGRALIAFFDRVLRPPDRADEASSG